MNHTTQYPIDSTLTTVHVNVTLPVDVTCQHCVFQWKYITGNSWGTYNGKSCIGCGRENEEFYGCSDIAIVNDVDFTAKTITSTTATAIENATLPLKIVTRRCTSSTIFSQTFDLTFIVEQYCQAVCSNDCLTEQRMNNRTHYNNCRNSCDKLCFCQ
jgi:hypothetical protein